MPKVAIREIDKTGGENEQYIDYAVLVPGVQVVIKPDNVTVDEVLITSKDWFNQTFDGDPLAQDKKGFYFAKQLVSAGLPVLYKSAYTYSGSTVKLLPFKDEITGATEDLSLEQWYARFFKPYQDKGKYDLRFITIGGLPEVEYSTTEPSMLQPFAGRAALRCAAERGDAIALLDIPSQKVTVKVDGGDNSSPFNLKSSKVMDQWVQEQYGATAAETIIRSGTSWTTAEQKTETCGRYGAIFAPTCSAVIDGASETVRGSFVYLKAFSKMIVNFPVWFAAAGAVRGMATITDLKPNINLGDADIDILQRRAVSYDGDDVIGANHIATNVIASIRPYGYVVWGNRTMHPLSAPDSDAGTVPQLVASSFLNIRQLCTELKKTVYRACRRFTFDPNSDTLWFNFKNAITPLLDQMKSNQGINGYQIIKVRTNKKALLVARIRIIPIEAVEDFDITVELTDSIEDVSVTE